MKEKFLEFFKKKGEWNYPKIVIFSLVGIGLVLGILSALFKGVAG